MTLKICNATCGTMAFPAALIDSFRHLEKVIPSSLAESPSFPEQSGETVGQSVQLFLAWLHPGNPCPACVCVICSPMAPRLSIPLVSALGASPLPPSVLNSDCGCPFHPSFSSVPIPSTPVCSPLLGLLGLGVVLSTYPVFADSMLLFCSLPLLLRKSSTCEDVDSSSPNSEVCLCDVLITFGVRPIVF